MQKITTGVLDAMAYLGFLVLFPGYVVYHYAVAVGWISPFLGGLFGVASVFLAVPCMAILASYFQVAVAKIHLLEWMFLFLVAYLMAWTIFAGLAIGANSYAAPAIAESLTTLIIWLAVFFVGCRIRLQTKAGYFGIAMSCLVIAGLILHAIIEHRSILGPLVVFWGQAIGDVDAGASTYQGIGRSIMVGAIVIAPLQNRNWKMLCVLSLTIVGLLFVGSRAHLLATIILVATMIVLFALKGRSRGTTIVLLLLLATSFYSAMDVFVETRAGEVLSLSDSTSWQARLKANYSAIHVVRDNPFLGDFGNHHKARAGYAHNALSAWVQYGALGFGLYIVLILYALGMSAKRILLIERCSSLWLIAFLLNLTALMLAIASEPILSSVFPALGWGFAMNALHDEQRRRTATIEGAYKAHNLSERYKSEASTRAE